MKDLFGQEVTMEQALALKHRTPPTDRKSLIVARTSRGLHPHNGLPLRQPTGETCKSCQHRRQKRYSKTYNKCGLTPDSRGPATDILVRWPACTAWQPKDPELE